MIESIDHVVGVGHDIVVEDTAVAAGARDDRSIHPYQGDHVAARLRPRLVAGIVGKRHQAANGSSALPNVLQRVAAVADPVDQAFLARPFRIEGRRIDEAPDLRGIEASIAGDIGDELAE